MPRRHWRWGRGMAASCRRPRH